MIACNGTMVIACNGTMVQCWLHDCVQSYNGTKVQCWLHDCVQCVKYSLTIHLTFVSTNNFGCIKIMTNFATDKGTNNIKT